jgi:hypothetical protein
MVCAWRAQLCKAHQRPTYEERSGGQVNLENVAKAGKPPMGPHEAIQKLRIDV